MDQPTDPIPELADEAAYLVAVDQLEPWLPAIETVRRREGLGATGTPRIMSDGQFPVIHLPPDLVLKLYGPWRYGPRSWECESVAYRAFRAAPDLPVPGWVAEGRFDADWTWSIVRFVPGTSLREAWDVLGEGEMARQMGWVGRFLRRLHDLPLPDGPHELDWTWFQSMLGWHIREAVPYLTRFGSLAPHLIEQVPGWLPAHEELVDVPGGPRLLHADMKDEHVLGTLTGTTFHPAAVIDWGRTMVGHPYYELGPTYRRVCHSRADLLAAVLDAADLPGREEPRFPRLALAYLLLHAADSFKGSKDALEARDLDDLADRIFGG
jgi:hypothetical protein